MASQTLKSHTEVAGGKVSGFFLYNYYILPLNLNYKEKGEIMRMIYVIDLDGIVRGVLSNDIPDGVPFWDDLFVETIEDGMTVFEFKCPADNDVASHIIVENYVAINDKDGHLILLKIREIQTMHDANGRLYKQVFAENAALELLKTIVRPMNLSGASPLSALQTVLEGTLWQPGIIEVLGSQNFEFNDYPTAVKAIQDIKATFGAEVRFRIELDGAQIIRRRVDLLARRGQETGKRFTYSKDITSIVRTEDTSELFTAIIPVGKADANGNEVTIVNVTGTFTNKNGTTVTKPLGQDWIGDPDALARWSDDGQHLMGVLKTEETAANALLSVAWKYLQEHVEPKITYEIDVVLLEDLTGGEYTHEAVRLGDTLIVEDLSFEPPLVLEARVIEVGFSMSDPERNYVKLGNFVELEITVEDQLAQLVDLVRQKEEQWATGGETIHKANTPPENPQVGQLWLDTSTLPEILKRWDGTTWRKATPTQAIEVGAETPDGAQDKADIAEYKAEKSTLLDLKMRVDYQVSRLLAQEYLKTQPVIDELNAAKSNYDTAYSDLVATINTAIGDLDVTQAEKDAVDTARTTYETAVDRLAAAIEDAEADVASNLEGTAVQQSTDYVQQYAERKITKGNTAPALPELYDLWIDTSVNPPVWKQWDGTTWNKFTRTYLEEMLGKVGATQIAANAITSNHISTAGLDAGVITSGTMSADRIYGGTITGTSMDVGNAGMINGSPTNYQEVRIWAGASLANRESAPFRVQANGAVYMTNAIIMGGSISITNDIYVGNNIYLGNQADRGVPKSIEFNDTVSIVGGGGIFGANLDFNANESNWGYTTHFLKYGWTFANYGYYSTVKFMTESDVESEFYGVVRIFNGLTMNGIGQSGNMYYTSATGGMWQTSNTETGFCGVGGVTSGISTSVAGVGVNFRTRKSYTPSSISLSTSSSNIVYSTHVEAIDISMNGFWLYVMGGSTTNTYRYWRGYYTA